MATRIIICLITALLAAIAMSLLFERQHETGALLVWLLTTGYIGWTSWIILQRATARRRQTLIDHTGSGECEAVRRIQEYHKHESRAALNIPVPSTPPPMPGSADACERSLRQLQDLYDKGLITVEEFESKRQKVLDKL